MNNSVNDTCDTIPLFSQFFAVFFHSLLFGVLFFSQGVKVIKL